MSLTGSMLKYLIFLFNLVFVLCGVLLIVWGGLTLKNIKDLRDFEGAIHISTIPILSILLGSAIFIVAFLGCCGAITENLCCTYAYAIFMLVITILQITLVVWMFMNHDKLIKEMDNFIKTAYNKNDDYNGYPMDPIQLIFNCCGLQGYQDYNSNDVPLTCCGIPHDSNETCTEDIYSKRPGCRSEFREFWHKNTSLMQWVGILIAVIEFVVLWFACTLANKIRAYD